MKAVTFDETKYKLVPVEPTPEMLAAWPAHRHGAGHEAAIYRAMLAAAPTMLNGLTESAAPAQQAEAYQPEFLERVRLLAGRLRGTDWCKPDLRYAATLLEEFYLTATAAPAPSVEAQAEWFDEPQKKISDLLRLLGLAIHRLGGSMTISLGDHMATQGLTFMSSRDARGVGRVWLENLSGATAYQSESTKEPQR